MGVFPQLSRRAPSSRRPGLALPVALLGLVLVSVLAIGIHSMSSVQNTAVKNRESAARAVLLAEAGAVHAAALIRDTLKAQTYTRLLVGSDNVANSADDGRLIGYGMSSAISIPTAGKVVAGGLYTVQIIDDPADPAAGALVDGNSRVLARCTGITSDNATASIDLVIGAVPFPGIATESSLEISSAAKLMGPCGGIHTNGNLTGGGHPSVATQGSASGSVTLDVNPKQSGAPPLEIPDLNPPDYWSSCQHMHAGNWTLTSSAAVGVHCVTGNVTSSGDFGSWASKKAISIIATGYISISSKPFIKSAHPDGILLLAGGDLDLQGDWGGEGLIYAEGHCYVSSKPRIAGSLVCKSKPGAVGPVSANLISGEAEITFDCTSMLSKRRQLSWYQRIGA